MKDNQEKKSNEKENSPVRTEKSLLSFDKKKKKFDFSLLERLRCVTEVYFSGLAVRCVKPSLTPATRETVHLCNMQVSLLTQTKREK